jgi:hypothetical protein
VADDDRRADDADHQHAESRAGEARPRLESEVEAR